MIELVQKPRLRLSVFAGIKDSAPYTDPSCPFRTVQQGVAYYAHPWDDGVTLLLRPAAGCPVIVDALMQAKGYSLCEHPCEIGRYGIKKFRTLHDGQLCI